MPICRMSLSNVVIIVASMFIISCGGGGSDSGATPPDTVSYPTVQELETSVRNMGDLNGVQGFIFSGSDTTGARTALKSTQLKLGDLPVNLDPNTLYKVTANGTLEPVTIVNESGQEINRGLIHPAAIADINSNYMIMFFIVEDRSVPSHSFSDDNINYNLPNIDIHLIPYLVHKPTGLAYNAKEVVTGTVLCNVEAVNLPDGAYFPTGNGNLTVSGPNPIPGAEEIIFNNCLLRTDNNNTTGDNIFEVYPEVQYDNNGNIYFGGKDNPRLIKIDTSNLGGSSITAQQLVNPHGLANQQNSSSYTAGWVVHSSGRFIVFNGSGADSYLLNLGTGAFTNLRIELNAAFPGYTDIPRYKLFKDPLGGVYFVGEEDDSTPSPHLFKIELDELDNVVLTDIQDLTGLGFTYGGNETRVVNGKSMLLSSYNWLDIDLLSINPDNPEDFRYVSANMIFSFSELKPDFGFVDHSAAYSIFDNGQASIELSNEYFYMYGTLKDQFLVPGLYRYNPATQTGDLFPSSPNQFAGLEVSNTRILDDGLVWFKALRLSDSATVYGTANFQTGLVEISSTTSVAEPIIFIMNAIIPSDFLSIDGSAQDWNIDLRVSTDTNNDGTLGHELTFLSQTQSATQIFGLIEFDQNNVESTNSVTRVTIDNMYQLVILENNSYIIDLSDDSEISFNNAGAIMAIGNAIEFSAPLSELTDIGDSPVVTVVNAKLENVSVTSTLTIGTHTLNLILPRVLDSGDEVNIQLGGDFELEVTSTLVNLIDTSGPTVTDITADSSGLSSLSISIDIADADIGSSGDNLTPTTASQLDITQDEM